MSKADDILKKYGITQVTGSEVSPKTSAKSNSSTGSNKADSILSKYGIGQVRDGETYDLPAVSNYKPKSTITGYNDADAMLGWNRYLATQKKKKQEEEEKPWYMKALEWLGQASDTTLPTATTTTVIDNYRKDTSYREPSDNWTAQQKLEFGYLYGQDQGRAWAYAEELNNNLAREEDEKQTAAVREKALSNPVGHTAGAILTAPLGLADFLDNIAEYNARGKITEKPGLTPFDYSQTVTGSISEDLNEKHGTLNENIPIIGGKGWGDVYGLGTSIAQSALAGKMGGQMGTLVQFFGSAAAAGIDDAKQRGASDQQALMIGTINGIAEGLAESIGIDNLLKIGSASTMRELLKNIAKQGVAEGLEEGVTTLLNNFADQFVMQDKSNFYAIVNQLVENGMPLELAKRKAWRLMANDLAFDMVGGFVSGTVHAAPLATYNTAIENVYQPYVKGKTIMESESGVDALKQLANDIAGVSSEDMQKTISDKIAKVDNKQSAVRVGKLYETVQKANNLANASANQADIAKSLERKGVSTQVAKVAADAIIAKYNGQELTDSQNDVIEYLKGNEAVKGTINDIINNPKSTVSQRSDNIRNFNRDVNYGRVAKANGISTDDVKKIAEGNFIAEKENGSESHYEVSADGQTIDKDGNVVTIQGIASLEKGRMVLNTENGTVDAGEVAYGSQAEALVYEAVSKLEGIIDTDTANRLSKHLMKLGDVNSDVYARGIVQAYTYGYYGYGREAMTGKHTLTATLTEKQRNVAYGLGEQFSNAKTKADQEKARSATVAKNATTGKSTAPDGTKYQKVVFDSKVKKWGKKQKAEVAYIDFIASNFSGNTVHVFESYKTKDGYFYEDSNGNIKAAPNGTYISSTGDIYLDLNAGNHGEGLVMNTFAHELYHHIQKQSPEKARKLAEFLVQELGYESVEVMVRRQIAKAEAAGHGVEYLMKTEGLSRNAAERRVYDRAFNDFVADSLETMFTEGDAVGKLQKLKSQDEGLFNMIKDFIDKWVKKLREFYNSHSTISIEGDMVRQLEKFDQIQQMFVEALVDAGDNFKSLATMEENTDAVPVESVTEYSYRSLAEAAGFMAVENDDGTRSFLRNGVKVSEVTVDDIEHSPIGAFINYSLAKKDISEAEATRQKKMFADICTMACKTNDFSMAMQFVGSAVFTGMKANADKQYGTTYDFPSICTKTQAVIDAMSKRMVKLGRGLSNEELVKLYQDVFASGNPVPCPECYVFSRWIGIGGLLDNIKKYQDYYGDMNVEDVAKAYRTMRDEVAAFAEEQSISFGKAKGALTSKLTKEYNKLTEKIEKAQNQGEKVKPADQKRLAELEPMMNTVKGMTWLENVYFADSSLKKVNPRFRVPNEVLFDLNNGEAFATQYKEAWAFRTTQGAGYGKAITPYAEARLGEGILVTNNTTNAIKGKAQGSLDNFFLKQNGTMDKKAREALDRARLKQKIQAFIGGQRFQSTSDARYENASDYLLAALEMQAMHGMVQVYTKVDGAVPALAAWNYSINQSLMPLGGGLDENGNVKDTSVGGMNRDIAFRNREKHETAGTITIGVNDNHIRAMFKQWVRDFIIPYHASGGKADVVAAFRSIQEGQEKRGQMVRSTDYSRTQGDKVLSDEVLRWQGKTDSEIQHIHDVRTARIAILTGGKPNMDVVRSNRFLSALYDKLAKGGEWEGVKLAKSKVESQIYPNEFWDQTVSYDDSGKITRDYLEYCNDLGFLHRFSGLVPSNGKLVPVKGYDQNGNRVVLTDLAYKYDENGQKTDHIEEYFWKVLTDRRMYDNQGKYLPQKVVTLNDTTTDTVTTFAKGNYGRQYDKELSMKTAEEIAGKMYSDRDYASQVDEVKNNTHDPLNHVYMGTTPMGIVKVLDLPKLPMLVTPQHIYSMAVSEAKAKQDGRFKSRSNYHDLGWDTVKKLPEYINKPVLIIKANTDPDDATFVVVTAQSDNAGNPIIAAVKPNGRGNYFNIEFPTNFMLSGYGKNGIQGYVARAKTENRILYANKNSQKKNTPSVQFADNILSSDYTANLADFKKLVKSKFEGTIFENSGLPKFSDREDVLYSDRVLMGSLFSGGGTLETGLVYQMLDNEFAVEYNKQIAATYTDNHGKEHMFVGDVRDFNSKDKQNVFYLHASPVCKNFSPASHSGGETTLDIVTAQATVRVLEEQMPQVFTVENVKRYVGSEAYTIITDKLTELGYKWDVDVYKASDYGNATKRERMIIRAVKDGDLPDKPAKVSGITSWGEATRDLWETDLIPSTLVKSKIEAIRNTPALKNLKLTKLDRPLMIYDTNKSKQATYAWADGLAPTLTTKCGDARIIMPDGKVYEPTPKFMGRIQGLPDDYKYPKAKTNAFKIIGNGIPTQLTKAVIGGVLDSAYEQTHDGQKLYSDRDYVAYDRTAILKESKVDEYLMDYAAKDSPKYAQAHIAYMRPSTFLKLTTEDWRERDHISNQAGDLDEEILSNSRPGIYLRIDHDTGKVIGHEGRHRMSAMDKAGIYNVPVLLLDDSNKMSKTDVAEMVLHGQFNEYETGFVNDAIPLNFENRDRVIKQFATQSSTQRVGERIGYNKTLRFSDRDTESVSNRSLLANAFEGLAQNDIERNKIQEYKSKIDLINAEERNLQELNAQIKELSFAEGKRDKKKISDLRFEAQQAANRINTYDKQLLRLEASKPLQDVLTREKKRAYQKAEQRGKEALEEYKKKAVQEQEKIAERYRDNRKKAVAKARETAEKRDAREKLQKLVLDTAKWLSYPTKDDVKCPDLLKPAYKDFLDSIDMSSARLAKGGDPTNSDLRLANAMSSLATALERVMVSQDPTQEANAVLDAGYLDLPVNFVQMLRDMTEDVKKMMVEGEYVVNTMTAQEVRKLSQMIRTLNHAIKEMSTLYANLRFANVEALGDESMSFMDDLGEIQKTGGAKDFVKWDNALPFYAFKRFGKGGESIFEGLMDAQDKLAFLAKKIFNFQENTWKGDEAKKWSEDTHTITLPDSKKELTLTTADAMSIYCLSRRQQGLQHLLGGGVRVVGIQKGSQKAKDSRSTLTIKDIDAIISSLTDRQKKVAEAIQEFMSTTCSEWGNEISMKRFLTKEFNEKFYFPIESNDENLPTKDPSAQQSDLFRLLNISATKPIDPRANNEVIIRNIFDVFTGHASDMARLNAFGMPLLDYMKWLNYREKTVSDNGQIKVRGVRKSMETAFGGAAKSYVLNLIKDVNGRPSDNGDPSILMKWMRTAKTASVGSSLRVATLQITSYPRAALVLSPKSLALGLSKIPRIEKAKEYCGIALWKSFGFYDTNISRSIEDQMKGVKDVKQKLIELSLKGAEIGDAITWGALWNACEYEVASTNKYKVGTDEFYEAVGKKLREVVYRTQVVDSTLTRSQIMRSKRGMAQETAAFMSEPTLSANILMDAGMEFSMENRRTNAKTAWEKTGKYVTRALAVYSIGQLTAALMEGFWDAWRDEEDEEFDEKFLSAFLENLALDLVPFNKIPIVSDVFEAALAMFDIGYYSSDKMSTTWLTQAVSAADAWREVLGGNSSVTTYNALYKTMRAVSSFYGVSFSGVMREAVALWNNTAGAYDLTWKILTYDRSKSELRKLLLDAIIDGDDRLADSLRGEFADDEIQDAIRTAIKDRYKEGSIEQDTAIQYLVKYGGMDEDDAYWKAEEWSYKRETGEDFGKYNEFFTAVETGKNLKAVIKQYTDNGVELKTLSSQITSHFKPIYSEMSSSERARIKGYLLNAFELCGVDREDATNKLQYWEYLGEEPDSDLNQYQIADYYEYAQPAGISADLYSDYCNKVKDITGEGKKEKRMAVINSLPISSSQKDALYYAEGWAESRINEAPWH